MPTERQIAANRQNARYSTGPRTALGKSRSSRNAVRHGLLSESVVGGLEDQRAYRLLELEIYRDYRPRTAIESQLVARLVSLIWRLRRVSAIEVGLFESGKSLVASEAGQPRNVEKCNTRLSDVSAASGSYAFLLASRFRTAQIDELHDRLMRYETMLWRQLAGVYVLLQPLAREAEAAKRKEQYLAHVKALDNFITEQ